VWFGVDCGGSVKIEDASQVSAYRASAWGERCFCKTCGSTLFWRMQDGTHSVVAAQLFENPEQFAFASEIFTEDQPGNYAFANATKRMTGREFMAAFMASKGG
jgi:hypothetical protein